jgi:hypothetical protein
MMASIMRSDHFGQLCMSILGKSPMEKNRCTKVIVYVELNQSISVKGFKYK